MIGKLFMAMSEDSFAARARGVATDRMRSLSYVLAGVLGGIVRLRRRAAHVRLLRARHCARRCTASSRSAVGGIGSNIGALVGGGASAC